MTKKYFVYSKITSNVIYDLSQNESIEINGVLTRGKGLLDECGVTQVTEEQFEKLKNLPSLHNFTIQKENGYLRLDTEVDIDDVVKDMKKKDKSYFTDEKSLKDKVENLKAMQGTPV